jgi:SNF2 family DNA or RNA helicase
MIENIKLITETKKGTLIKVPATIKREDGRIYFIKSPFALKDEIKAMKGSRWHGYIPDDGRKIWSIEDCTRNNFQLEFMVGGNPYENWDQPLKEFDYSRPLFEHQKLMSNNILTYHYTILAAEMGTGKTLSAIEAIEKSNASEWWWVGPKSAIAAVEREFQKWGLKIQPRIMTYDRLRIEMSRWEDGNPAPQGVIFDESSRCKSEKSKRTNAAQHLADNIRKEWGWEGYVVLMSGTPSPKSPVDWWSQCEICYPGFIREGSSKAFERRLAIFEKQEIPTQGTIWKRVSWLDDENKCAVCGQYENHENHSTDDLFGSGDNAHEFKSSKNEVAYLYERLKGLVLPIAKKDCYDIPDKIYREIVLEPSSTIKRVAKALVKSAPTTIQGLTWLRELSDGFQYREVQQGDKLCPVCNGEGQCYQWSESMEEKEYRTCDRCDGLGRVPNMVREAKEVKTPKDAAVISLLEENEDIGRILIFAGFQGSIDRIVKLCHKQQWNVVKVDGRGWKTLPCNDEKVPKSVKPLDYWYDQNNSRVAFVAHPTSGGMGLTLTEASTAVFYSNDFMPESRSQAEDRIHRPGIDANRGAIIVDLFHLGTDRKVRDVLLDNRRLETMTLGEMQDLL